MDQNGLTPSAHEEYTFDAHQLCAFLIVLLTLFGCELIMHTETETSYLYIAHPPAINFEVQTGLVRVAYMFTQIGDEACNAERACYRLSFFEWKFWIIDCRLNAKPKTYVIIRKNG